MNAKPKPLKGQIGRYIPLTGHRKAVAGKAGEPTVATYLALDAEYRKKAESGTIPKIAPKRLNPSGEAWLPIMRTRRWDYTVTVVFSNTKMAHQLKKTNDWVVIYFKNDKRELQATVLTEFKPDIPELVGKRVVRGMEKDCLNYYSDGAIDAKR